MELYREYEKPSLAIAIPAKSGGGLFILIEAYASYDELGSLEQILSTFKFTDENIISWEKAVELIRNCQVTMVTQTHSRNVSLVLKDGTSKSTIEPEIDMVIDEAQTASTKCGFYIDVLTE